jgi:hypothetical protein
VVFVNPGFREPASELRAGRWTDDRDPIANGSCNDRPSVRGEWTTAAVNCAVNY